MPIANIRGNSMTEYRRRGGGVEGRVRTIMSAAANPQPPRHGRFVLERPALSAFGGSDDSSRLS